MRVLVTGAGGFIGHHVVDEVLRRGLEVAAVLRPDAATAPVEHDGLEVVRADLRRPPDELGEQLGRSHAVIHLAASTRGGWRGALEHMVVGTENLLGAARRIGWSGRFVHVSSFAVYGLNQIPRGARVDEGTPVERHPSRRDVYAWGKALQERVVRTARDTDGLDAVIVRPGAVYGPGRQFQYRLGRTLGPRLLLVFGGGNPMPLTFVGNTASLLVECAVNPVANGVYNAVDPEPMTQLAYARRYARGRSGRVVVVPVPLTALRAAGHGLRLAGRLSGGRVAPPGLLDPYVAEPSFRRFDFRGERATRDLGWTPPHRREEALRLTFGAAEGL